MIPATACPRCGSFAELSSDGWRTLCAVCHVAARHPTVTSQADPQALFMATARLASEFLGPVLVAALVVGLPKSMFRLSVETPWWFDFAYLVVSTYGEAVLLSYVAQSVLGGKPGLDQAFERANARYLPLLVINVVTNLASLIGLVFCVVGMFVTVAFSIQAVPLALYENLGTWRALTESVRRAKSHWLSLSLVSAAFTIPLLMGSMVQIVWATAHALTHEGASPPTGPFTTSAWINAVATLMMQLFSTAILLFEFVAWAKLRPQPPVAMAAVVRAPAATV
jgi:hypothetical protein